MPAWVVRVWWKLRSSEYRFERVCSRRGRRTLYMGGKGLAMDME